MMKLKSDETELRGSWSFINNEMIADEICERIESLVSSQLIFICDDNGGWRKLFQDPDDYRYWELSFPESYLHGGGAPLLRNLQIEEAKLIFNI
jgi:hypothetical protein